MHIGIKKSVRATAGNSRPPVRVLPHFRCARLAVKNKPYTTSPRRPRRGGVLRLQEKFNIRSGLIQNLGGACARRFNIIRLAVASESALYSSLCCRLPRHYPAGRNCCELSMKKPNKIQSGIREFFFPGPAATFDNRRPYRILILAIFAGVGFAVAVGFLLYYLGSMRRI